MMILISVGEAIVAARSDFFGVVCTKGKSMHFLPHSIDRFTEMIVYGNSVLVITMA
jgi:hypothetical protein